MPHLSSTERSVFQIDNPEEFNVAALQIFQYQYKNNSVYRDFVDRLHINTNSIHHYSKIPFLPISFFKSQKMVSGPFGEELVFSSSGTSGMQTSKHYVKNKGVYRSSFLKTFELFFGKPEAYVFLALLPSYLEREGSSLVYMVDHLMKKSKHPENGFYLNNYNELALKLRSLKKENKRVVLFGVTFALLDMAKDHAVEYPDLIIIETGGMKGRGKELVREDLHQRLKWAFHVPAVYSEYGMTELLSQAYSMGEGLFKTPPWMKVLIRDANDPFTYLPENKTGGLNIIDLANIHSCSFIATQDLGRMKDDGRFEVLGRFDNSDIRGCNLMIG